MKIQDDGVGFDVQQKKESGSGSSGLGLKSMRNRAKMIGANLAIQSEPGKGTTYSVTVPLKLMINHSLCLLQINRFR